MEKTDNELKTVRLMVGYACRRLHGQKALCPACRQLSDYAAQRLAACPFGVKKPVCGRCTVHCYRPEMRQAMRAVMRTSGAHMLWRHPLLTLRHLIQLILVRPKAQRQQKDTIM